MDRTCTRCSRPFAAGDLVKSVSKDMEADRKAAGMEGVRFLDYLCPACGTDCFFVDILPREGEQAEEYRTRRVEMEQVVRALHSERVHARVIPVREPDAG